jgi:GTP-binding protein
VIADIPGLIEGAAEGAGLGDEFLAHIERCRLLVHVVGLDNSDPAAAYEAIRSELTAYGAGLDALPELIVLSKRDLVSDEVAQAAVNEWQARLGDRALGALATSAATGAGLGGLRLAIFGAVPEEFPATPTAAGARDGGEFEAEHITYRPEGQGFAVEREDGAFRVRGRGIELLFARHDLANPEALAYLEQRLREIGVIAALERAGFASGDEVRIGSEAFELHP